MVATSFRRPAANGDPETLFERNYAIEKNMRRFEAANGTYANS
jgi:hypothetical protein